jgi:ribosomal protein S18 acetylase RimI-like enzyme
MERPKSPEIPVPEYRIRYARDRGDIEKLLIPEAIREDLEESIAQGEVSFLMAESSSGRVLGQVGIRWESSSTPLIRQQLGEDVPCIAFVEVSSELRSRGIGHELMQEALVTAKRQGHHQVFLAVNVENPKARAFYTKPIDEGGLGFRDWDYGQPIEMLVFADDKSPEPTPELDHILVRDL